MANQSANTIADAAAMNKEERGERAQSPPSTSEPLLIAGSFRYLSLWQVPGCSLKPRPIRNVATLARAASSSGARAAPGAEACAAGNSGPAPGRRGWIIPVGGARAPAIHSISRKCMGRYAGSAPAAHRQRVPQGTRRRRTCACSLSPNPIFRSCWLAHSAVPPWSSARRPCRSDRISPKWASRRQPRPCRRHIRRPLRLRRPLRTTFPRDRHRGSAGPR